MTTIILRGMFNENEVQKIREKAEGKTHLNFMIDTLTNSRGSAVGITTAWPNVSEEELRNKFYEYILKNL